MTEDIKRTAPPRRPEMRILISNDDGINAPGLKIMEHIAHVFTDDVWIVAPESEQSGASHSLTLTEPMRIREISPRKFAARGTPTDCVMLAVRHIIKDRIPDLVLSGVNRGGNMGEDVTYSGTVAAAMEGTLLGIPSIALSQFIGGIGRKIKWGTSEHMAPDIIDKLLDTGWPKEVLININFPDAVPSAVKSIEVTVQGRRDIGSLIIEERVDPRGIPYQWFGFDPTPLDITVPDRSDFLTVRNGSVSITPLHLDLTHHPTVDQLRNSLSDWPSN